MSISPAASSNFTTLYSMRLPKVFRAVGWLLGLSTVAIILFLIFTPWVQTTSGGGTVTALDPNDRQQNINALVSGRIMEWYVQDGSRVKAGDPIVRIIDNDPLLLERLDAERNQIEAKLTAAQTALSTARNDERRTLELFEDGLASRREYEQAQIRVEDFRARVAEAAAELSRVAVNVSRQSFQTVIAPRDGVILRVNAGALATFVSVGDVVATFVPDDVTRAVEIYIDGRDVALVKPGAKVRLQFEGWPVVQFSGWPSVAVGTFGGLVTAIDPSAQPNGLFRILVIEDEADPHPWPDDTYVRFGAIARGWVLLEQVPIGYEVWRQLNNFPPDFPATSGITGTTASAGAGSTP